tara:strand:+ start:142 stop:459 length:318 start_codon:yes stop_codon:yes gene_type:complete
MKTTKTNNEQQRTDKEQRGRGWLSIQDIKRIGRAKIKEGGGYMSPPEIRRLRRLAGEKLEPRHQQKREGGKIESMEKAFERNKTRRQLVEKENKEFLMLLDEVEK